MGETGTAPPGAVPLVAGWYREEIGAGGERWTMDFLSHAGDSGEIAVMEVIGDLPWFDSRWGVVFEYAPPEFVTRLSRRWLTRHRGELPHDPFVKGPSFAREEAGPPRTRKVGGDGGGGFSETGPVGRLLTGLTVTVGVLGRRAIVKRLVPYFGDVTGTARGRGGKLETTFRAPKGHAIAGLLVKSGNRIDGLAVVFAPLEGGRPVMKDAVLSPWFGGAGGGPARLLGGDGTPVVGIHGRSGADLDGIGLLGED
jgi:hypothetical protein